MERTPRWAMTSVATPGNLSLVERIVSRGVETCRMSAGCLESEKLRLGLRGIDLVYVVAMREEVGLCAAFWCGVVVLHPSELLLQEPDADE